MWLVMAALLPLGGCLPSLADEQPEAFHKSYVFVAYSSTNAIAILSIDKDTGDLTDNPPDQLLPYSPDALVLHPTQPFLYVTSNGSNHSWLPN